MWWKLLSVSLRTQLQYPLSFLLLSISHLFATSVEIVGIAILFARFHQIEGWTLPELGLLYGVVHIGFALAEAFSRGFDTFSQMVREGDFDRILLRPLSPLFQIALREVQAIRIGRFLQGSIVLIWSLTQLSLPLSALLWLLLAIVGTFALFYGLFILQATLSFWTVETLELMNIATYGGVHAGQYPLTIYTAPLRGVLTFLIPIGCVAYYPVASLLHPPSHWIAPLLPLAGLLFLLVASLLWQLGVRHYRSTGS